MSVRLPAESNKANLRILKVGTFAHGDLIGSRVGTLVERGIEVNLDGFLVDAGSQIDSARGVGQIVGLANSIADGSILTH